MKYLLLTFAICTAVLTQAAVPSAIAIKDARVVLVSGEDLPKGTVVMRAGLIQEVGANVTIPPDAWVIDGAGLTVYPGFIDALSTWGIPNAQPPAGPNRAATAVAAAAPQTPPEPRAHGPEDRPQTYAFQRAADLVDPSDARLEAARAAGFTTAATFPDKGIFEGLGAMIDLAGERGRDMVVAQPIGQQIIFRVAPGGFGRSYPTSLMGNIAYVRQLYLDLDQYREATQIYNEHPGGNRRPGYDHELQGLAESPRILLPADEAQQIDRMLLFGQEIKTPFVVYGLHEAYRRIDELKQANVPLLISLKWPEKPKNADPAEQTNYRDLEMRAQAPAVPGMLAKAGVKFAFYSDGVDSAPALKKAVKKAIDAGLSETDAIKAFTLSAADIYGLSDRLGSIEKGKIANLVVTKGSAFDEKTTVQYVFVDGQQFEPSQDLQKEPSTREGTPGAPAGQTNIGEENE